jgi:hypothetical protein
MKKLLYIGGCGRSGSTILGLALGNVDRALDLGEVVDFARFEGKPNGFEAGTANYAYWRQIVSEVSADIGRCDWSELRRLTSRYDSHAGLLLHLISFGLLPRRGRARYYAYISSLYRRIVDTKGVDVFIDSSKYAGRLYHLAKAVGQDSITVVHLIRNPVDMARSMRTDLQGRGKGWIVGLTYYFAINLMIKAVIRRARLRHVVIRYEDFVADPARSLRAIGDVSRIDVEPLVAMVTEEKPLELGYIFNGNRMRLEPSVTVRRTPNNRKANGTWAEILVTRVSDWLFARDAASERPSTRTT